MSAHKKMKLNFFGLNDILEHNNKLIKSLFNKLEYTQPLDISSIRAPPSKGVAFNHIISYSSYLHALCLN